MTGFAQPPVAASPGRTLCVRIKPLCGSVEHYYHFVLGFLVPLLESRETTWGSPACDRVVVRRCGPMDRILEELRIPHLVSLEKPQHTRLFRSIQRRAWLPICLDPPAWLRGRPRLLNLAGRDHPTHYDQKIFRQTAALITDLLGPAWPEALGWAEASWAGAARRLLLIRRDQPADFYLKETAEIPTAGAQRRSIPNSAQLHAALFKKFGRCQEVTLEGLPFSRQIALFRTADVIIAQHGAALTSLLWAGAQTAVVEIRPQTMATHLDTHNFFGDLCRCLGQAIRQVRQAHEHAAVDPEEVCRAVGSVVG